MKGPASHNKFIFSPEIDGQYLISMYGSDYPYMAEVFAASLETFDSDIQSVQTALVNADLQQVKRGIHKLKPVFGFTGMLRHQEQIEVFERMCVQCSDPFRLLEEAGHLVSTMLEGKKILHEQHKNLFRFISQA